MRWMLSRTASSGRPTMTVLGCRAGGIDLHLDGQGVDAEQGEGAELGEHGRLRE